MKKNAEIIYELTLRRAISNHDLSCEYQRKKMEKSLLKEFRTFAALFGEPAFSEDSKQQ